MLPRMSHRVNDIINNLFDNSFENLGIWTRQSAPPRWSKGPVAASSRVPRARIGFYFGLFSIVTQALFISIRGRLQGCHAALGISSNPDNHDLLEKPGAGSHVELLVAPISIRSFAQKSRFTQRRGVIRMILS